MGFSDWDADVRDSIKKRRLSFLTSCYAEFKAAQAVRVNKATNKYEKVWCAEEWFDGIIRRHFENVDPVRRELLDRTHLIDRHKVASCLLHHIMDCCPVCYESEGLNRNRDERRLLNARFALYAAVQLIHKWHEAYDRPFSITSRGNRFVQENIKWLAGSPAVPVQFMAQTLYLLEQLCVVEGEYAKYSCVNDDAETECTRAKQSIVPEFIAPSPQSPPV